MAENEGKPAPAVVTIYVNGREKHYGEAKISYAQVVQLAYPNDQPNPDINYTVTYSIPHGKDGTLAEGQSVAVTNGMSFNVAKTHRS